MEFAGDNIKELLQHSEEVPEVLWALNSELVGKHVEVKLDSDTQGCEFSDIQINFASSVRFVNAKERMKMLLDKLL
eukprot:UC4_evm1s386